MTIEQFCDTHTACKAGQNWALASCSTMQEVWDNAKPEWLVWIATRPSVLTDEESRLFAVFAARQVQHLMTDSRSVAAIDVAERFAHSKASVEELEAAKAAADAAATAATAAWSGDSAATYAAAYAAAKSAAVAATTAYARADAAAIAAVTANAAVAYAAEKSAAVAADAAYTKADAATIAAIVADAATAAAEAEAADAATIAAADAIRQRAATRKAQAQWLRENTTPNFL